MYNGFIFEKEIDKNSLGYQIKFAYNYAEKLFRDIIYSYIAIFYPPYLIAFVIIQLTRKKFFDSKYMKKIKKVYGIKQNDYKECYEDIKDFLKKIENGLKVCDYNKINKEKIDEKDNNEIENKEKENNNEIKNNEKDNNKDNNIENSENKTPIISQIKDAINNMTSIDLEDKNNNNKSEISDKNEENENEKKK